MRAPLLAALLCATALSAQAGGIFLPGTSGYGSAPPPYTGPTKAQAVVAATGCSFTLASAPAVGDVLVAECVAPVTLQAGWTQIDAWTTGFTGRAFASAYHFVVSGDGTGPYAVYSTGGTPAAIDAFDVTRLSDTVWANHFTACGRAVEASSFANLSLSVSPAKSTLVLASAGVTATSSTNVNGPANITGLSGDFVGASSIYTGMGGATGQLTATGTAITASWLGTSGGSAAGASLDLICLINP